MNKFKHKCVHCEYKSAVLHDLRDKEGLQQQVRICNLHGYLVFLDSPECNQFEKITNTKNATHPFRVHHDKKIYQAKNEYRNFR